MYWWRMRLKWLWWLGVILVIFRVCCLIGVVLISVSCVIWCWRIVCVFMIFVR